MVSIIIPVIRPRNMPGLIDAIHKNAGIPASQFEIIWEEDTDHIGCPKMVKRLQDRAKGENIVFLGDDTTPRPGFLSEGLRVMGMFPDGWGLVAFSSYRHRPPLCPGGYGFDGGIVVAHFMVHRRMLDYLENGEIFSVEYRHHEAARELWDICAEQGRALYAIDAYVRHDNQEIPSYDADVIRVEENYHPWTAETYSGESMRHDKAIYRRRRAERQAREAE